MAKNNAAKRWVFTLNNYTEKDVDNIKERVTESSCTFAIVGKEKGKEGTMHLQGYINLKRKIRMNQIKQMISNRAHVEPARGSDCDNDKYCGKEGDVIVRIGKAQEGVTEKGGGAASCKKARMVAEEFANGKNILDISRDDEMWAAFCYKGISRCTGTVQFERQSKREVE
ncbi:uncharacterized protein LOC121389138 [Gigantopelta aegis]|uniref:uncharacterized protein LOC121389138 n=1 Tax=Gigantopelta aegis TaxID=1735272 RepID=UPI001B888810|nr:uncharacterized protein LOC121389138 [Gigantopelta aegis]